MVVPHLIVGNDTALKSNGRIQPKPVVVGARGGDVGEFLLSPSASNLDTVTRHGLGEEVPAMEH